jgi:hypothetical protein
MEKDKTAEKKPKKKVKAKISGKKVQNPSLINSAVRGSLTPFGA